MIEEYIERYAKAREISKEEALTHKTVQETIKYYREVDKDANRNGYTEERVKPKGC